MMVLAAPTSDAAATSEMRSMRTGVLIHPDTARDGRFLILPHPRTGIPTYYLFSTLHRSDSGTTTSDADLGQLLELSTLKDARYDRSWMISGLNQVVASAQLEILSRVDVRFLVVSMLYSALDDGKFRSLEDTFEQIALTLHSRRKDELVDAIQAVKTRISQGTTTAGTEVEEDGVQQEWTDLLTFGTLPIVKQALTEVADVQGEPTLTPFFPVSLRRTKLEALLTLAPFLCIHRSPKWRQGLSAFNSQTLFHPRQQA